MADTKKITIEILDKKKVDGTDEKKSEDNTSNASTPNLSEILHPLSTYFSSINWGKYAIGTQMYSITKSTIKSAVSKEFNRYITTTEDYLLGNTVNNVMTAIGKTTSFGEAVLGGAMTGSMSGNPIGTAIGAGVAATGWVVNQIIDNSENIAQLNLSLNQTNYNINFNRTRAGLTNLGRGTEN